MLDADTGRVPQSCWRPCHQVAVRSLAEGRCTVRWSRASQVKRPFPATDGPRGRPGGGGSRIPDLRREAAGANGSTGADLGARRSLEGSNSAPTRPTSATWWRRSPRERSKGSAGAVPTMDPPRLPSLVASPASYHRTTPSIKEKGDGLPCRNRRRRRSLEELVHTQRGRVRESGQRSFRSTVGTAVLPTSTAADRVVDIVLLTLDVRGHTGPPAFCKEDRK